MKRESKVHRRVFIFLPLFFLTGWLIAQETVNHSSSWIHAVTGEVNIQKGDQRQSAVVGALLESGDVVECGASAFFEARSPQGYLVRASSRSQVLLDLESGTLMCKEGTFLLQSTDEEKVLKVEFPSGLIQIKRGSIYLEVFENGEYDVTVLGVKDLVQVDAKSMGQNYMNLLATGQKARFSSGTNYSVQLSSADVPSVWKDHPLGEMRGESLADIVGEYKAQNPGKSEVTTIDGIRIFTDTPQGEIRGIVVHFGGAQEWIEGWYSGWFKEFSRKGIMIIIPELTHFGRYKGSYSSTGNDYQDLTRALKKFVEDKDLTRYAMVMSCGSAGSRMMYQVFESKQLPNPIAGAAIHSGQNFLKPNEVKHLFIASPKRRQMPQPQAQKQSVPVLVEGFQKIGEVTTYVDPVISWHHVFQDQMLEWIEKEKVFVN